MKTVWFDAVENKLVVFDLDNSPVPGIFRILSEYSYGLYLIGEL